MRHHTVRFVLLTVLLGSGYALLRWAWTTQPTFRLFFAWPTGGTWVNLISWAESLALAGLGVWFFRDHVGRHLAAWWARHHGQHMIKDLEAWWNNGIHFDEKLDSIKDELKVHVAELTEGQTAVIAEITDAQTQAILENGKNGEH